LKYVVLPQDTCDGSFAKKPGFFNTEADVVNSVRNELGLGPRQRFPLAYLMEAADDIAYCLSDIEDGIEKGLITIESFMAKVRDGLLDATPPVTLDSVIDTHGSERLSKFLGVRTQIFNLAVSLVAKNFVANHDAICRGEVITLIDEASDLGRVFAAIGRNVAADIYRSKDAEHVELAGRAVVYGLLKRFSPLLCLNRSCFQKVLEDDVKFCKENAFELEMRLAHMLPQAALRTYSVMVSGDSTDLEEWHYRGHLVLDYICGMTDHFALETFQLLSGIRINGVKR
jgi:dGTPase